MEDNEDLENEFAKNFRRILEIFFIAWTIFFILVIRDFQWKDLVYILPCAFMISVTLTILIMGSGWWAKK